jgi:hypothetical protein
MKESKFSQGNFGKNEIIISDVVAIFKLDSIEQFTKKEIEKISREVKVWCIQAKCVGEWKVTLLESARLRQDHWHPTNANAVEKEGDFFNLFVIFHDEGDAALFKLQWC